MNLKRFLPARVRLALGVMGAVGDRMTAINIGLVSAGVAFYGLLAIFPTLTAMVALWGLVADPTVVAAEVQALEPMVPAEAFDILEQQVNALASGASRTLGWASAASLAAAFWASRSGVAAIIGGLNKVHDSRPRGGIWHALTALMLSGGLILAALVALASVVIAPVALAVLPLGPYTGLALNVMRWMIGIATVLFAIGALYRFGPSGKLARPPWRHAGVISPGTVFAVVLWGAASWGFSTYLANFGNYDKVYGSLGAVIALLMWFYVSGFVVLLGAIIDVELTRVADRRAAERRAHASRSAADADPQDEDAAAVAAEAEAEAHPT
ncbi:MAG: YihY family inner membrane protein [Deinococcus-Thermus bacterium]|jgi:membrane protein|nr:YihY family inner membrane protein [Deinococcota bacterium]